MKVLIDTSLLMLSAEIGRDIIGVSEEGLGEKLEIYILEDVIRELEGISKGRGKKSRLARVALKIASNFNKIQHFAKGSIDDKIIRAAEELKMPIATADLEMIKKARKKNVPILLFHRDLRVTFEGWRP